jgi:hypothetical protein
MHDQAREVPNAAIEPGVSGPQKERASVLPNAETLPPSQHYVALGYLRAFIIVLVVAHHSVLAYHPYAPAPSPRFNSQPFMWAVFPIVDPQRWRGVDLFVGFNDIFFMSLMFFLSGLFVWPSLVRKGPGRFARDRALRLGLPFAVAAALLAPLAYYPAYHVTGVAPGFGAFWKQWLSLGTWPSGPAWFIWLLLAFDGGAAAMYRLAPHFGVALGRLAAGAKTRPFKFFLLLVATSALAYIPLAVAFGPVRWLSFGPFSFQASRLLHYAVYFFIGIGIGACGIDRGLLASDGNLARRWPLWVLASMMLFFVSIVAFLALVAAMSRGAIPTALSLFTHFTFVSSCAASGFAFLALFVRFMQTRMRVFDSLSANAYGIYLLHYGIVTWLQFSLLRAPLSGPAKGSIVFLGALTISWGATILMRRIPAIARVV